MNDRHDGRAGFRGTLAPAFAVALTVLTMILGSLGASATTPHAPTAAPLAGVSPTHPSAPPPAPSHRPVPARPSSPSSPPALTPPSSGRGLFFNTSNIALAPASNCTLLYAYACVNDSYDPSITLSNPAPLGGHPTTKVLGVAFTQLTNAAPCGNATPYAQTEIGFSYSLDLGATFSAPIYLGLTNCTLAAELPSAYQPTLTSLSNGTFVLAYIAYNLSNLYAAWYTQGLGSGGGYYSVTGAALVLTKSYDGGVTWTPPAVLNVSFNPLVVTQCCTVNVTHAFTPQRPWITAVGQTVYLAWMNDTFSTGFGYWCEVALYTYSSCYGAASSQVHLVVSKNGGTTWSAPTNLITVRPPVNSSTISSGEDPYVLVTPNGTVFVAYMTDYYLPTWANRTATNDYLATAGLEVARSYDNGTTFSYTEAVSGIPVDQSTCCFPNQAGMQGEMLSPQLAWGARYSQLYLTWTGMVWGIDPYCLGSCPYTAPWENIFITNSSDGGTTWAASHMASAALNDSGGSAAYNPAIAVLPNGQVDIATAYVDTNRTVNPCSGYWPPYYCPMQEVYLASTDNATTFSDPILISDNITGNQNSDPSGWYDTATIVNGTFVVAWAHKWAAGPVGGVSYWPGGCCGYPASYSQISVSSDYAGPGLTLTFQENGLPTGDTWSLNVMGNPFQATAPGSITVSGVPPLENMTWNVSVVAGGSSGYRYLSNQTPLPPVDFARSSTVYANFSEQVLLQISTNPPASQCPSNTYYQWLDTCWDPTYSYYYHFNYDVHPFVGSSWVAYNAPVTLNASQPNMCFTTSACYIDNPFLNLTFLSWTGAGAGSTNTTSGIVSITPKGPVDETANFQILGVCQNYNGRGYAPVCRNNESLEFDEHGLPAGTPWAVTITNNLGSTSTMQVTNSTMVFSVPATSGIVSYTIWSIPSATSGEVWVGTGDRASPIVLPIEPVINVSFALAPSSVATFGLQLNETGLPAPATSGWSIDFGSQSVALHASVGSATVTGGSGTLTVPAIYNANDTAYYPKYVLVERFLVNNSAVLNLTSLPSNVSLDGPSLIQVVFGLEYLVIVTSSPGGTTSPGSSWVPGGTVFNITAFPDPGYRFVGWSGTGAGGVTTNRTLVSVRPSGPDVEAATFQWGGGPAWDLTIVPSGLPSATTFTLNVGKQSFSGSGNFTVRGLPQGNYTLSVPYAYSNASQQTRYVGNLSGTSLTFVGPGDISLTSNGSVDVSFQAQYEVSVTGSVGGSTSPFTGAEWVGAHATVALAAIPSAGYEFVGWTGTGPGSVSSSSTSIQPSAAGPFSEFAQFRVIPPSAITGFSLTVQESGLPPGVSWSVAIGSQTVMGTSGTIVVSHLNGTYPLSVAPPSTGAGTRYLASGVPTADTVTSNSSLTVSFQEQYWVAISAGTGGNVSLSSGWVDANASVTLGVILSPGWQFAGWVGTGAGSYTGPLVTTTITPSGPINETATFSQPSSSTSNSPAPTPWGILGAALVGAFAAGAVAALLLSRRRPPSPPEAASPPPEEEGPAEYIEGPPGDPSSPADAP